MFRKGCGKGYIAAAIYAALQYRGISGHLSQKLTTDTIEPGSQIRHITKLSVDHYGSLSLEIADRKADNEYLRRLLRTRKGGVK